MKTLILALAAIACTATAHAGTYKYQCQGGIAVANENNATLTWRGTVFRDLKVVDGDCRVNWEAGAASMCIMTKYGAELTIGKDTFECEMSRSVFVQDQCSGVLSRDGSGGLSLTNPHAHPKDEGMCSIVGKADVSRVLQACVVGRRCTVTGISSECVDTGECVEIQHVTKARR